LKSHFDVDPNLIKGKNGVFDVVVDDRLVFSKHRVGRFPDPGEVMKAIKEHKEI
jgi:selT/selW/selH-like putative selenoprotein